MIVYADSSAVLSWLLGEPDGAAVRKTLEAADFVVTSELTLVECDRAFRRAHALEELSEEKFTELRAELARVAEGWVLLRLSEEIVERARGAFPEEPIRSLDALHLASILTANASGSETTVLTYDQRMRRCARALGLPLVPR